jgi:hypothetical protein
LIGGQRSRTNRAMHLDIGKDDVDIGTRFQDGDGLVRVGRLDDFEARAFDRLSGTQPQQEFVFHDQDHRG